MGSSNRPREIQAQQIIEDGGGHKVGDYKPISEDNGGSWAIRCPQPFARMLNLPDVDEYPVWVDLDRRLVVARIPDPDNPDDGLDDLEVDDGK